MSTPELLSELDRLGVRLEADGDRLRYSPRSALTPELFARLKAHKAELLALLRGALTVPADIDLADAAAVWQAALARLAGDPSLPADVLAAVR
jgi:hypothetical protein